MARKPKDRTAEVQAVFDGLQYCTPAQLREVIEKSNKLIDAKKDAEIEAKKKQIEALQAELAELEK